MHLKFRTRYLLYMLAVHTVIIYLTFRVLRENKPLFIATEVLILISCVMAIQFYNGFRRPSDFIASGIEAIKDQDFSIKFVATGSREIDQLIDVYNLMIDQLRQERTRQAEQRLFLDKLIEAAPIAILIFDYDDRIASVNPKACQLLNVRPDDVLAKPLAKLGYSLLAQVADLADGESRIMKPNGIETYKVLRSKFIDRGFRRSFLIIEELTPEILATEKKAYSKVIRMMAHEVNNSIGAVNSILTITESELPESDLKGAVRVAIERNDRLNHFMRRFADVVRLPTPNPTATDMTSLARRVVRLMQSQAEGRGITLSFDAPAESTFVTMDTGQMEQVLVNIVKNALEACESGQVVVVNVTARQLTIRNNGQPIQAGAADQLFNPFYSTKPAGQGIGLTLTREILLNHGFTFSLQTGPDGWTTFMVEW